METGPPRKDWWKMKEEKMTFGDIAVACFCIPVLVIVYALDLLECVWISIFRREK